MLKLISFNAAILDIRLFAYSFYRPVDFIDARLRALIAALENSDADIICLQELFHYKYQQRLYRALSYKYPHVSGMVRKGWRTRLGNELLVLSRFPLRDTKLIRFKQAPAEELRHTNKGFLHVRLEIPAMPLIDLVNFHMSAGGKYAHPESAEMEAIRNRQIMQLVEYCQSFEQVLLAGDLNAGPDSSQYNYLQLLNSGFRDLTNLSEFSWDPANPLVKYGSEASLPAQRIDHILANAELHARICNLQSQTLFREHCVSTKNGYIPLSDHYGVCLSLQFT